MYETNTEDQIEGVDLLAMMAYRCESGEKWCQSQLFPALYSPERENCSLRNLNWSSRKEFGDLTFSDCRVLCVPKAEHAALREDLVTFRKYSRKF